MLGALARLERTVVLLALLVRWIVLPFLLSVGWSPWRQSPSFQQFLLGLHLGCKV